MALALGTRLGPYEIQSAICAGGMGKVYRATDTNLGRDVTIKVLPDAFAQDPERIARRRCGWHTQESPWQVVDSFSGCLGAAGHHDLRGIEAGRLTRGRNEFAGRLLPASQ